MSTTRSNNSNNGSTTKSLAGIPEERKLATGLPARIVRDANASSTQVSASPAPLSSLAAELNARPDAMPAIVLSSSSSSSGSASDSSSVMSAPAVPGSPGALLPRSGSGGSSGTTGTLPSMNGSSGQLMSDEAKRGLFRIPESQVMTKGGGMASAASSVMSAAPSVRATRAGSGAGDTKASSGSGGGAAASVASGSGSDKNWQNLQNLKNLLSAGFITPTEYKERKQQLIDEMTGTTMATRTVMGGATKTKKDLDLPVIVPKGPPDFTTLTPEQATKYSFDLATRTWHETIIMVKLDTTPFARGGLRLVYHLQDLSEDPTSTHSYVAKISMDPRDNADRDIYFRDVEMQSVAKYYAKQFNEYNPPKKVDFVAAWILRLDDREGAPLCGVERFIDGPYRKHNNNFGYVSEDERHTPQAFSHFTYESSNHQLLCIDIQGVSDMYTDPQVHTRDGKGFGKGNMGQRGIDKFLQKHRCNQVCRYLKLPPINADYSKLGTIPVQVVMSYEHVKVVDVALPEPRRGMPDLNPNPKLSARVPLIPKQNEQPTQNNQPSPFCSGCVIL